jgi:hypothetical protein
MELKTAMTPVQDPDHPTANRRKCLRARAIKRSFGLCLALSSLLGPSLAVYGQTSPTGVRSAKSEAIGFSGGSVGVGLGYAWALGELTLDGHTYPFILRGLSFVHGDAVGIVTYNLRDPADFFGTYAAAGPRPGEDSFLAALENRKGVIIYFNPAGKGLSLNLSGDGLSIGWERATK